MKRSFYFFWIIGAVLIAGVTIVGLGLLSAMALNPTGYVSPTDWGFLLGSAAGLVLYWSVLCWAIALLRRKPLWSVALIGAGLALAYGYPAYDAKSYASQRAEIASHSIEGEKIDFTGKTAVLLWGVHEDCVYNCWNLALYMEARVLVVNMDDLRAVDFDKPVDLLDLPLYEVSPNSNPWDGANVRLVETPPASIDFALINIASSSNFDDAFERFRPRGIARDGLHIDALIIPTSDGRNFDLTVDDPMLRLMSVSRNLASKPWLPGAGSRLHWNGADRQANDDIAVDYFCSNEPGDNWHWCHNAFR